MTGPDLVARAKALNASVEHLAASVNILAADQSRTRRIVWSLVAGSMVLLLVIAAVVALGLRLQQVQQRTSNDVLCPLYRLFITFEPRAKDNPQFTPEERQQRIEAYQVIHRGYDALGCQ